MSAVPAALRASRARIVAAAAVFGLAYGLSAPLIAQALDRRGLGETLIGLNAAMYALGVLAVATSLPRFATRLGLRPVITLALLAVAVLLPGFPLAPWLWLWFPLRFALGIASESMFVTSETWVNASSDDASRGTVVALYTAALSLGFALGPVILGAVGAEGMLPYAIGAACALAAFAIVALPGVEAPPVAREAPHGSLWSIGRLVPLALAATALNSALETAGLTFMPIYAMRLGWDATSANLLIAVLMIGAIVLQLPIGWLGTRYERRSVVLLLAVIATAGACAWPFVLGERWLAYALAFLWGGAFVGIYTLMMTAVGSRFQGGALLSIYAVMSIAWAAGAMVGPALTGAAMEISRNGLPWFAALACGTFVLLALRRRELV